MSSPSKQPIALDFTSLPAAPQVLIQLIDLLYKSDVSFEELEKLIEKDSALSAKVIAISNSAAYGQWNDVLELKRVLVVLGTKTIKSIAVTAAVHQFFSRFCDELGLALGSLWLDALTCARLCKNLATLTDYSSPDEAYLAGLLHQLGKLVLLSSDPDGYQLMMGQHVDQTALLNGEQARYGIHCADLAANALQQWGVSPHLQDALRYQFLPAGQLLDVHPLIKLLNLSSRLTNRLNHRHQQYQVEDPFFSLNQSVVEELVTQATQAALSEARGFDLKVDTSQSIPCANIDDESLRLELAKRVRQIALLETIPNQLAYIDNLSDTLRLINENLHLLFGFSRTIFFFPDKAYARLTAIADRNKLSSEQYPFEITFQAGHSLVTEAGLHKTPLDSIHQSVFSELTMVDQQIKSSLLCSELLCLPLLHHGRLMAVIAIGFEPQQAQRLQTQRPFLIQFATVIANSMARQQQLAHEHQQQLELKQLELETQTRKMIHEANNPLTIINNYLEVLSMSMQADSSQARQIDTIKEEIERVAGLLLQFRDAQTQQTKTLQRIDINQLITGLVALFQPTFYKLNDIQCQLELDSSLPDVSTEQNKLKQVITNLVKNAAEALPDRGVITISTKPLVIKNRKQYIEISVSDNGPGIPQNHLDELFSPVKSNKGPTHSGLGLTIVNKLIKELNGSISYHTSNQGGAEFIIHLPID